MAMLSEREEHILGALERDFGRSGRYPARASVLLLGAGLVFGGELLATSLGIVLALVGFVGMVSASAAYAAGSRSRPRSRNIRSALIRALPLLRRW
jgi:hypothetical protein